MMVDVFKMKEVTDRWMINLGMWYIYVNHKEGELKSVKIIGDFIDGEVELPRDLVMGLIKVLGNYKLEVD